jgi:hypothetical protein
MMMGRFREIQNPTVLLGDIFVSIGGLAFLKDQIQQCLDEPLSGFFIEMRKRVKQPGERRIPSIKTVGPERNLLRCPQTVPSRMILQSAVREWSFKRHKEVILLTFFQDLQSFLCRGESSDRAAGINFVRDLSLIEFVGPKLS